MIVPIVLGGSALAVAIAYHFRKKAPPLTADQQMVHDVAMTQVTEPKKLIKLAQVFHAQGYPAHATSLMQRAGMLSGPKLVTVGAKSPAPTSGGVSGSASGSASVSLTPPDVTQGGIKRIDQIYFNFTPAGEEDEMGGEYCNKGCGGL